MKTDSVPAGYHSVTPSLIVRGAAEAIDFYQRAFGATLQRRMEMPDGKVMHAEINIGDSPVMLSDEFPDWGALSPASLGGTPGTLHIYVADVDAAFAQAVAAGAEAVFPVSNQFWGDRMGRLKDPFGHSWALATRVEELSEEEMARRGQEWLQKMPC